MKLTAAVLPARALPPGDLGLRAWAVLAVLAVLAALRLRVLRWLLRR